MAIPKPKKPISATEYLLQERKASAKSEFYAGEVFAVAGASIAHNRIVRNLLAVLHPKLKNTGCEAFPSDLRVHIPLSESYVYPDISILCGRPEFADSEMDTLLNPAIIIEILSASAADFDRGGKFARYRSIPTLVTYLLVDSESKKIERFIKENERWWLEDLAENIQILLPPANISINSEEIYEGVF